MPYLNWREREIGHFIAHKPERARMDLQFSREELDLFIPQLEEIFERGGHELRMDLPDGWIVFWKLRDSGSRLLLAHPQPDEWVATVALEQRFGKTLIERLQSLQPGETLNLGDTGLDLGIELYGLGSVSNVELQLIHK